jgi:putative DNA primase/helicase
MGRRLRDELPGILAWAVRGALAWRQRGLEAPPANVQGATREYVETYKQPAGLPGCELRPGLRGQHSGADSYR